MGDDHYLRIRNSPVDLSGAPNPEELRDKVEPWLSALLQSEHLALLIGNGLPTAVANVVGCDAAGMEAAPFEGDLAGEVERAASEEAAQLGRSSPNIEDRLRAGLALLGGLRVMQDARAEDWQDQLDSALRTLVVDILGAESGIREACDQHQNGGTEARRLLVSFLLTFASRSASRERLSLFTTNYDRLVEYGCDWAGLRTIDRFVGALQPVFRSSRVDVDLHYNPPGIRGEPRYLEGVLRLGKVHGSLDWRYQSGRLCRVDLPFGAPEEHPAVPEAAEQGLMVYPNTAKGIESAFHPYAELMRDMSAALCRPNSALVTYGYGFGDDHINAIISDMLAIPSTHLAVISYDWCEGRLERFRKQVGREAQLTLMIGPHFGDLQTIVDHYLPKPAIDTITFREAELRQRRLPLTAPEYVVKDADS